MFLLPICYFNRLEKDSMRWKGGFGKIHKLQKKFTLFRFVSQQFLIPMGSQPFAVFHLKSCWKPKII